MNDVLRKGRSLIVAGCVLSALFALPFNLLPILLGSLADTYSLAAEQIGLLGSALTTGWLAGSITTFILMPRLSRRVLASAGISLTIAGYLLSNVAGSLTLLDATWFLVGFGTSIPFSIAIQSLGEVGGQERVMGMKQGSEVFLGAMLLYLFPVIFMLRWGYAGASVGLAAILLTGFLVLKRIPRRANVQSVTREVSSIITGNGRAWVALGAYALFMCGQVGLWAFIERIGVDLSMSGQQIGIVLAILKVLGGVAALIAVFAGRRFGGRWPHIVSLAMVAIGAYLLDDAGGFIAYAVGAWAWEFGFSLSQCYQMAAVPRLDRSGRLTTLVAAAAGVGAAFGPAIAGYLRASTGSYSAILLFTTSTVALVVVAYWRLMAPQTLAAERHTV